MKWLKIITVVLIVTISISTISAIILTLIYTNERGNVEGTGFVYEEIDGAGDLNYDVDDYGNLYFAVMSPFGHDVIVYDTKGDYKYTLPVDAGGAIGVKIDDDNNILVCDARREKITIFNDKGILVNEISDIDYLTHCEFFPLANENVRERNGVSYINENGNITKDENGVRTVVFTVPSWQRWKRALTLVAILSAVFLFLRIFIAGMVNEYKTRFRS